MNESAFREAIFDAIGYAPLAIARGKFVRFATSNRRSDTAGWAKLFLDGRAGVFGDHRTGTSEFWSLQPVRTLSVEERVKLDCERRFAALEDRRVREKAWARHAEQNARMWSQTVLVSAGDAVDRYLKMRGIEERPIPSCLRLHHGLPYFLDDKCIGTFVAMVAPLVAPDGRVVALHRTYLSAGGAKAEVPTPKKLTPAAGLLAGSAIPLARSKVAVIGIAEGVETALAAALASGVPTVAAYCAHNLATWGWPSDVRRIVVFGDNDRAGNDAANKLAERARRARLEVSVVVPTTPGLDWADVYASRLLAVSTVALSGASAGVPA